MDLSAIAAQVCKLGACNAGIVNVSAIIFDRSFRVLCESNACGNYGKCWMCPPYAGDIDQLIQIAQNYQKALVYQTISVLKDSYDFDGMMEAAQRHGKLALSLSYFFSELPFPRKLHLGAGGCHMCDVCAKQLNEPCRRPEHATPALEAYGVNVSSLATSSGMRYINGSCTVTYFGALLFCET
jgi:predicted metal-binding protein